MIESMLVMMLTLVTFGNAHSQGVESMYGTYSVTFQPMQRQGELESCSLVYNIVQPDFAYLNGRVVVANGNISFTVLNGMPALTMKVGVKEVLGNQKMVRPNFAYLQTANYSTAKVKQQTMEGDDGYRLFLYPLTDSSAMKLFNEMMDSKEITLAFNREKDGMDVMMPIEFSVGETKINGEQVERIRTEETMRNFIDCIGRLSKNGLDKK
jgi:hypothetical protein